MTRKCIFLFLFYLFFVFKMLAQIGIGTNTPNAKAALDVRATDKGVLFPKLTSAQRNAITNPPNGLHIYNSDEGCLNYYDSIITSWNCYCEFDTCKVVVIKISANVDSLNFYESYAKYYPYAKKFTVIINPGVIVKGWYFVLPPPISLPIPLPAIRFNTIPGTASIKIINYGNIYGLGGIGGNGASGSGTSNGCNNNVAATNGSDGFPAIETKVGVKISIDNYGLIAGGAGGGGGGGRTIVGQYGGGGGGGASFGGPGKGGSLVASGCGPFGGCGPCAGGAQNGTQGDLLTGGPGGAGASGGGTGGAGGALGQTGLPGPGTGGGLGGGVGKIVYGGIGNGNSITNLSGGISYGSVDL